MVGEIVKVPVTGLFFVNLTKPHRTPGGTLRYAVSFRLEELPTELAERMPNRIESASMSEYPVVQATSSYKPRIFGLKPDQSDVAEVRTYADRVGCTLDEMVRGCAATVLIRPFEHDRLADGFGLGLEGIVIDPEKLFWPTPDEPRNRRKFDKEESLWNAPTD